MQEKIKVYALIGGEIFAGVILCCSAVQTMPVKNSRDIQLDRFKGEVSQPTNASSPFAPFLGIMGMVAILDGGRRYWLSFSEEETQQPIKQSRQPNQEQFHYEHENQRQESRPTKVKQVKQKESSDERIVRRKLNQPIQSQSQQVSRERITDNSIGDDLGSDGQDLTPQNQNQIERKKKDSASSRSVHSISSPQKNKNHRIRTNLPTIDILDAFAHNKLSTIFTGAPRAGKSTAHNAWIAKKYEMNPKTEFRFVTQKNNRFLGLNEVPGSVVRVGRGFYDGFYCQLEYVHGILQDRLELPEDERDGLDECWLGLDDWYSMVVNLEQTTGDEKKDWINAKGQIADIVTLGAELGVGISANTHTLNLEHFGLASDANIRGILNICALGRLHVSGNRKEGGFDAITNALKNPYLIDDYYRAAILKRFNTLRQVSRQTGLPIVLSTLGEPEIGLMPDLSWVKDYSIPSDFNRIVSHLDNLYQYQEENNGDENSEDFDESTQVTSTTFGSIGLSFGSDDEDEDDDEDSNY